MATPIRPLHDRILVQRLEEEKTTASGIVIPDSAKEKPSKGEVLAVGNGKPLDNGTVRALAVSVGDRVLFGKYAGNEIKIDGIEYLVLREEDVIAVLEP
jgi:chaperonin GroES